MSEKQTFKTNVFLSDILKYFGVFPIHTLVDVNMTKIF